jgi:hypothetical protein
MAVLFWLTPPGCCQDWPRLPVVKTDHSWLLSRLTLPGCCQDWPPPGCCQDWPLLAIVKTDHSWLPVLSRLAPPGCYQDWTILAFLWQTILGSTVCYDGLRLAALSRMDRTVPTVMHGTSVLCPVMAFPVVLLRLERHGCGECPVTIVLSRLYRHDGPVLTNPSIDQGCKFLA